MDIFTNFKRNSFFLAIGLIIIIALGKQFFPDSFANPEILIPAITVPYIEFESGDQVSVQIADTPYNRAKGLMYVEELSSNQGMIFMFPESVTTGFWMKNTLIPLDIVFLSESWEVVHITSFAQPCTTEDALCEKYSPETEIYMYALEVNGGWAEGRVEVGDTGILVIE